MTNFESLGLSETLLRSLSKMDYTTPTPIQAKAIPLAIQGRDILGSAQTGTGKTAAFSIPLVESLLRSPTDTALVLTPTRELAKQVLDVIHQILGHQSPIKTAFIIGGEPMHKQLSQLRARPRVVVGTPGRINDHLERGTLKLNETRFIVLDETDRMLDMGFGVQLNKIFKHIPAKRQTLMFSATLPKEIVELSGKYLTNPERVSVGATNVVAVNIKQEVVRVEQDKKYAELLKQLYERNGSVIVFAKTKHSADRIAKNLCRDDFTADALHGDLRQNKRNQVMKNFRNQSFRVLVATDIAARGLDVPHIEHVINYDMPQVAEDYIHRMGRTARAGAQGSAVSFIASQDMVKWRAIERLINPDMAQKESAGSAGKNKKRRSRPPFKGGFERQGEARQDGQSRPFYAKKRDGAKRNGHGQDRPFSYAKKNEGQKYSGNDKPYAKRQDGENPGGQDRPFGYTKRQDGENRNNQDRPYSRPKRQDGENRNGQDRPFGYAKRQDGEKRSNQDKPYSYAKKQDGGKYKGNDKPYAKRQDGENRGGQSKPYAHAKKQDGGKQGGNDKPFGQKKKFGGKKPFNKFKPKSAA